jgi:hypothetical protein
MESTTWMGEVQSRNPGGSNAAVSL